MTQTALILGASGKIGTHAIRALETRGWTCRIYNRKTDDMTTAAEGCDVIVNGLNPPNYHNWAKIIPEITEQVIAAAKASGASVILPGNVYVYGDQPGPWTEATPHRPVSRKGQIRAEMEKRYARSGVQVINLRAGNYIDPDKNGDVFSLMVLPKVQKGRIVKAGPTSTKISYAFLPDWAEAAAMLAEKRHALARYEEVNFPGHTVSLDDVKMRIEALTGQPLKYTSFPWWLIRVSAPFWELARELLEMRYLWDVPHSLSGTRFEALLPEFEHTRFDDVLRQLDVGPDKAMAAGGARKLMA